MTFLTDFEHDVFISYASVDNHPPVNVPTGWITTLAQELQRVLDIELGRSGRADIWMDYQLKSNDVLTDTLLNTLDRSATLLMVLSPGYLESEWCERERNIFLQKARQINAEGKGRIFLVEKREMDWDEKPEEIRDIKGASFWVKELEQSFTLGDPAPRIEETEYYRKVDNLARDLADQLKRMQQSPAPSFEDKSDDQPQQVLLANVTDDLVDKCEEIKHYLQQQGISVIDRYYPMEATEFRAQLAADLERSKVFVQLLSEIPGRQPSGSEHGHAALQFETADQHDHDAQILQWHEPGLMVDDFDEGAHKDLLLQPTVISEPLEQFKSRIADAATKEPQEEPSPCGESLVFLNFSSDDQELADRVREWVDQHGYGYVLPMTSGKADEIRKDLERSVQDSDAMVLFHGQAAESWVRGQLGQFRKLKGGQQKGLAIFEGPPRKPIVGMKLSGMKILDCRDEIDWDQVQGFLNENALLSEHA
jgi:hypothetical protein